MGDRDGNPFVTPAVTEETLRMHRSLILDRYTRDLDELWRVLSPSVHYASVSQELMDSIARDRASLPGAGVGAKTEINEPYRAKILMMQKRLARTRRRYAGGSAAASGAYHDPTDLLADLVRIRESLIQNGGERIARGQLRDVIRRVQVFGFSSGGLGRARNIARSTPLRSMSISTPPASLPGTAILTKQTESPCFLGCSLIRRQLAFRNSLFSAAAQQAFQTLTSVAPHAGGGGRRGLQYVHHKLHGDRE